MPGYWCLFTFFLDCLAFSSQRVFKSECISRCLESIEAWSLNVVLLAFAGGCNCSSDSVLKSIFRKLPFE